MSLHRKTMFMLVSAAREAVKITKMKTEVADKEELNLKVSLKSSCVCSAVLCVCMCVCVFIHFFPKGIQSAEVLYITVLR